MPFANYSTDFSGKILEVLDLNDVLEVVSKSGNNEYFADGTQYVEIKNIIASLKEEYLSNGQIDEINLENSLSNLIEIANDPDEGILILTGLVCEQISRAKNNYANYEFYANAVNTAMADGGVFTNSFFTNVDDFATESQKNVRDFEQMKVICNSIKVNNLPKIANLKTGLDKTIENFNAYLNPITELFNQLFN